MTPDWRDFTGDPAEDIATIIARYCYLECLVHPVLHLEQVKIKFRIIKLTDKSVLIAFYVLKLLNPF